MGVKHYQRHGKVRGMWCSPAGWGKTCWDKAELGTKHAEVRWGWGRLTFCGEGWRRYCIPASLSNLRCATLHYIAWQSHCFKYNGITLLTYLIITLRYVTDERRYQDGISAYCIPLPPDYNSCSSSPPPYHVIFCDANKDRRPSPAELQVPHQDLPSYEECVSNKSRTPTTPPEDHGRPV